METANGQGIPVSEIKNGFLEYYRQAAAGMEIVAENKYTKKKVSLVSTDLLTGLLDTIAFTRHEEFDDELGIYTLSVDELPTYGEGKTRGEALESLIDGVLEYRDVYTGRIELFSRVDDRRRQALMLKILRCGGDREAIRKALGY